jgi:hypothetical protein
VASGSRPKPVGDDAREISHPSLSSANDSFSASNLETCSARPGRVEMWRGSIRFGLLFPSLSFDGVLIALP